MLVYGDRSEMADAGERLDQVREMLAEVAAMQPGIARHAKLVAALIEAGRVVQGVADAGLDEAGPLEDFMHDLARCVVRSWDSRFTKVGELPDAPELKCRRNIELRVPEGFAFYAVYPESYIEAARRLRLAGAPRVIGIRSIGTALGAIVAAALDAPLAVTARPFGDPFARQVELPAGLIDGEAHYVIVDEGPGLSGSSFGAVADWLEQRGVPLERIAFLPSHGGEPGPEASEAHRRRWRKAQRVAAEFDAWWLNAEFGPLEPMPVGERLKFLGTRGGERLLLKFAGLGSIGERKLDMARVLHAAGFTPESLGLVHGFMVEHWCTAARPLRPDEKPVEEIGRYIGARARLFPAPGGSAATLDELAQMVRRNTSLAFGTPIIRDWDLEQLSRRITRVRTDNRLDREKWLRLSDGRLLKTDALDHHQGHDLIGCQDVAWDVAGAIAEFDLETDERARLATATGCDVDPALVELCLAAYCSFRLGQARLSGATGERYAARLHHLLHQDSRVRESV